jgi:predicted nucleotide-binding protein
MGAATKIIRKKEGNQNHYHLSYLGTTFMIRGVENNFKEEKLKYSTLDELKKDYDIIKEPAPAITIKQTEWWIQYLTDLKESKDNTNPKIFIVHGHNEKIKSEVVDLLKNWNLEYIILADLPNQGQTIIEKLERISPEIGFAIILMTADDEGIAIRHKRKTKPKNILKVLSWGLGYFKIVMNPANNSIKDYHKRARQNVIFEAGYFINQLKRNCVNILKEEEVETPSDISGIGYTPIDEYGHWKNKLADELKAAGYNIDKNKI